MTALDVPQLPLDLDLRVACAVRPRGRPRVVDKANHMTFELRCVSSVYHLPDQHRFEWVQVGPHIETVPTGEFL